MKSLILLIVMAAFVVGSTGAMAGSDRISEGITWLKRRQWPKQKKSMRNSRLSRMMRQNCLRTKANQKRKQSDPKLVLQHPQTKTLLETSAGVSTSELTPAAHSLASVRF